MPPFSSPNDLSIHAILELGNLKAHASWIRDTLDLPIARDGPEAISVEDALYVDQFLRKLLQASISVQDIRLSRIHLAILEIAGGCTRWPHRLIERADAVIKAWETKFGPLIEIGTELLGPGGRLEGISSHNVRADDLLVTWLKQGVRLLPDRARKWGDLGFNPGDWWINPLLAFKAGIIDSADPDGGLTADKQGAYALLLAYDDELSSTSAEHFVYRSHSQDKGRYRLTSATRDGRKPIRVLRSHTLRSFHAPRARVRYDGLYRVVGWTIQLDKKTKDTVYDITFDRLPAELPMDIVLRRPFTDEIEDYKAFKRMRHQEKDVFTHSDSHLSIRGPAFGSR